MYKKMKNKFLLILIAAFALSGCNPQRKAASPKGCSDDCMAKTTTDIACTLTSPELRERKETVLASLKAQVIEKKELRNGFAFKFLGTDEVLDELSEFIKTERQCCTFFTFNLSISGDKSEAWLELMGPRGAKEFISSELGL